MDAKWLRNSFFYLIVLVFLIVFLIAIFNHGSNTSSTDTMTNLMVAARTDAAHSSSASRDTLTQDGQNLTLVRTNGDQIHASMGQNDTLAQYLQIYKVDPSTLDIKTQPPSSLNAWIGIFGSFIPILIFGGVLLFMMRQAQGSNNQAL